MHPILIKLGPVTVYSYGLLVATGVYLGYLITLRIIKIHSGPVSLIENMFVPLVLSSFIGARLMYVLINFKYYYNSPMQTVMFWEGGFVYSGGFLAALLFLYINVKKTPYSFSKLCSYFAPGLALGHALGRLGCFFAGCCYGKPSPSGMLGVIFSDPSSLAFPLNTPLYPVQLFSFAAMFLLAVFLYIKLVHDRDFPAAYTYLVIYGIFRFFIEYLRGDDRGPLLMMSLTITQIISLAMIILGLFFFFRDNKYAKR